MDNYNLDKLNEIAKPRSEKAIQRAEERKATRRATKARVKALATKLRCIGKQGSTEHERYVELNTDEFERDHGRLYCQLVYFGATDERPLAVYWLDETMESGDFIAFEELTEEWQRTIATQVYVM